MRTPTQRHRRARIAYLVIAAAIALLELPGAYLFPVAYRHLPFLLLGSPLLMVAGATYHAGWQAGWEQRDKQAARTKLTEIDDA